MVIESAAICDIGLVRETNEDYWEIQNEISLYAVADGMGGHKAGEIASKEAIRMLVSEVKKELLHLDKSFSLEQEEKVLENAFIKTNSHIYNLSLTNPSYQGMGTTLCCLLLFEKRAVFAHVGDSRLYRYRHRLERLTRDHLKPGLSPKEAPSKGVLYRCVGTTKTIRPEIGYLQPSPNDLFLLCTDGLTDYLTDSQIEATIRQELSLKAMLQELTTAAKIAGGGDNITIVSLKIFS